MADMLMKPVAYVHSCYREKFGIPRQPGLVTEARGEVRLLPEFSQPGVVRGLEGFSHLWLVFQFHAIAASSWKPTVRPPRLGGNQRMGVFATRSMFRPNPIGLSVVKLEGIQQTASEVIISVSGLDLLDGTPVLDIKPYLPYADHVMMAAGGFADDAPNLPDRLLCVEFSALAEKQCILKSAQWSVDVRLLLVQILQQDPRPAYRQAQKDEQEYGMRLYDFDVRWVCSVGKIKVITVLELVNQDD